MSRGMRMAAGMLLAAAGAWGQMGGGYHAAGIAQGGDIAYPMDVKTPGIVTLDVSLDAHAAVQNVSVVRDVPPLTDAAVSAVKSWQYTPAMVEGQGVAGVVRVNVVFNPYNPSGVGLPGGEGGSPRKPANAANGNFQPAAFMAMNYASYPPNTVAAGTVVLQVRVGQEGKVDGAIVVRGKGALSGAATTAAKMWVFTPAMYQGAAIASDVVVVFVFAAPQAGTR